MVSSRDMRIAMKAMDTGVQPYRRVFICSPYSFDPVKGAEIATRLCRMAVDEGQFPFAPHLLYPRFLDEHSPDERELGIKAGISYLEHCDEVWVYAAEGISSGMRLEIEAASRLGVPVKFKELEGN